MVIYGREDLKNIASCLNGKTLDEVTEYHAVFWKRGKTEIKNFDRHIAPILKKEAYESKQKILREALNWKMACYRCPKLDLTVKINPRSSTKTNFSPKDDRFILVSLHNIGINNPNVYNLIRQDVM